MKKILEGLKIAGIAFLLLIVCIAIGDILFVLNMKFGCWLASLLGV